MGLLSILFGTIIVVGLGRDGRREKMGYAACPPVPKVGQWRTNVAHVDTLPPSRRAIEKCPPAYPSFGLSRAM